MPTASVTDLDIHHLYAPAPGLRYLFLDFNAYFASVEQHDDPSLFGKPVIVTPLKSEYTSAIAASYEARPFGIKRGTRVKEAREMCPGIAVRYARHDRYVELHQQLMAEIQNHLPLDKVYSIDEAAFKLSRSEADPEKAKQLARQIKQGMATKVGPAMRASIGLAPTRLLAKLAAERVKPDGLTVLELKDLPHRLAEMPLTDIPGVGAGIAKRLAQSGIHDFPSLWALEPKRARAIWGSVMGERFWYALHGYETIEEETKKSMIGHSRVLTRDHEAPAQARIVARALLLKAASRLRHHNLYASRLSLSLRERDSEGERAAYWEASRKFFYSQNSYQFLGQLDGLWEDYLQQCRRKKVSPRLGSVTVYLHSLTKPDGVRCLQQDLFADPQQQAADLRQAKLWRAVDLINSDPLKKFERLGRSRGENTNPAPHKRISLASQAGLDLNYLGVKIAFSRVPDAAEFFY